MKNKKVVIILGALLVSISNGVYIKVLFRHLSEGRVIGHNLFTILKSIILDIIIGFFRAIEQVFYFVLSWEGALFFAVILTYSIWKNFLKEKTDKDK